MVEKADAHDPWQVSTDGFPPNGEGGAAVRVEVIENVEPLDRQFGIIPKKTVPDALHEVMFGQPDPTEAEVAATGGDASAVPPLQTYAILDAAKVTNLPDLLGTSGLEYRCLFMGNAYDEMKHVAPWIVKLEDGNSFTRRLFTGPEGINGLWGQEPGTYVRSRASLEEMWRHFRKFTRIQDDSGAWVYFRFWDAPVVLEEFCDPYWSDGSLIVLLTPSMAPGIRLLCRRGESEFVQVSSEFSSTKRQIKISRRKLADRHCLKKLKEISGQYKIQYPEKIYKRYQGSFWRADDIDLEIMALLHGYFGNVPEYHFNQDSSAMGQSRKQDFLMKLRFFKKQGMRDGL